MLIETATNRRWEETKHTHNKDSKYGIYRYDSRFAFPVKDNSGNIINVRAYDVELIIRNASDRKKYLYDIVNIKENTANANILLQRENRLVAHNAAKRNSVSENNITKDKSDVKFSLKKPLEETKNLLALHNLTEEKLSDALKLGGLPMPSIAVVKKDMGHSKYGPISLVFDKNTIDPQSDSRNKVYGGDGYTPTAPSVEYPVNYDALRKFEKTISDLSKKVGGGVFSNDSALRRIGVEDVTDMSLNDIANKLSSDDSVRDFINKVKSIFKGNKAAMDEATVNEFGATVAELEKAEKL